ncbi:DoxX family protein [Polynucleobacter paneuropaeus]|jgi:putative oxidoreductase|nr:DoxX family protein [Polynucleobacter paneuropaeus]MBT8521523.1 DoxX family protein [Polynucleobacter paneuropaeus]MBT8538883.1 DoxX family protein [Polynucleobacter paneuropaeus]RAZ46861.1 DoxX family protein [Polynucleobacter paneuropaeus]
MSHPKNSFFNYLESPIVFFGRLLIASSFLLGSYDKIVFFPDWLGYLDHQGLPYVNIFAIASIGVELIFSLALVIGFKVRFLSFVLAIFCLATTLFHHAFWTALVDLYNFQLVIFLKDISLSGGLLLLSVLGPKGWSIDHLLTRKK